ncbi:MAG TPA: hypothetical protein VGB96_02440 [Archangium sp.]
MSPASHFLLPGALLLLTGVLAHDTWRQEERMATLAQQVELLREEVRSANARASTPATEAACPPALPPEAVALRVAQLLEERQHARTQSAESIPTPSPVLTPEAQATVVQARWLADSVLASGAPRPEDAAELRELLAAVGHLEEGRAIRQRLLIASNRGQLKLPAGTLLFHP